MLKLSALIALDAFVGGLIVQSMFALWLHLRFGIDTDVIGSIFFGANILSGISALLAVKIVQKIVLINTVVFTYILSNFPLMPNLPLAITLFLLRYGNWFQAGNTTLQIILPGPNPGANRSNSGCLPFSISYLVPIILSYNDQNSLNKKEKVSYVKLPICENSPACSWFALCWFYFGFVQ